MSRTKREPDLSENESEFEESPLVVQATSEELQELADLRAEKKALEEAEKLAEKAALIASTQITMNLPASAGKGIQHAGTLYVHGRTYNVDNNTKWALEEMTNRCWAHESSLKESENKGRKQRRAYVGSN